MLRAAFIRLKLGDKWEDFVDRLYLSSDLWLRMPVFLAVLEGEDEILMKEHLQYFERVITCAW